MDVAMWSIVSWDVSWARSAIVCVSHDDTFPFGLWVARRQLDQTNLYDWCLVSARARSACLELGGGLRHSSRSGHSRILRASVPGLAVAYTAKPAAVHTVRLAAAQTEGIAVLRMTGLPAQAEYQ